MFPHHFLRANALLSTTALISLLHGATTVHAESTTLLPPVSVASTASADLLNQPLTSTTLSEIDLAKERAATNDTAALFDGVAGVSAYNAGGVSSLPAIHGLGYDRVNLLVNGMQIGVACANEMNPPLSYIDPANVGGAKVMAGITPVSLGGDSIAGTIVVNSPAPHFATGDKIELSGRGSIFYRSNADEVGGSISTNVAGKNFSLAYTGTKVSADNYKGGSGDGIVRSSEYSSMNHNLTGAIRAGAHLLTLEAGLQYIPRQGFPNQYMDMTHNRSVHLNALYEGAFSWGTLEARAYWKDIRHEMNFLDDKGGTATGGMPMNTNSKTMGYALQATLLVSAQDTLRLGNEFVHVGLDDWWPPVPASMMMGPNPYININNGKRNHLGTYGEWERNWGGAWSTLVGLRSDVVWMNTGDVQPYSWTGMMNPDAMAATAFNAASHAKTDSNWDATFLVSYTPSSQATYELGYARKTRTPNLYERYSWGRGSMSSRMVGWFGDGNGYVGDLALKPETAHTFSATGGWKGDRWALKVTPYYTRIENYIGVRKLQSFTDMMGMPTVFVQLQFVNHEAEIYGVDVSGSLSLWDSKNTGKADLKLATSWVDGKDLTSGTNLYHFMPVNAKITLDHSLGAWSSSAELVLVAEKSEIDSIRNEPRTAGYALLNLQGSYTRGQLRFDAGIKNLFNSAYDLPLGGVSLGDNKATGQLRPVPGMGRSFNFAVTAGF